MVCRAKPNETPEEAAERRLRESKRVEERVVDIETWEDWERELKVCSFMHSLLESVRRAAAATL